MKTDFDLVIVGAGIVGTVAAYLAAQRHPGLHILLIDRSLVGSGATQHSLGLDYPYGHSTLKKEMTKESMAIWDNLDELVADLRRNLTLYGFVSASKLPQVRAGAVDRFEAHDKNILLTDIRPVLQESQFLLEGLSCKYNQTREITVRLAQRFCSMNEKNKVWEGIHVEGFEPSVAGFTMRLAGHPDIQSSMLLFAPGPWMPASFLTSFFNDVQVRTKKIVSLFIDRKPKASDPAFFFFDEDAFLLPMIESSRWMLSFTVYTWDCDADTSRWMITHNDRQVGLNVLKKYVPAFIPRCHGGRAFCDAYHEDWTPLITLSSDFKNLALATGGSGSGFRLAPAMASRALNSLGL